MLLTQHPEARLELSSFDDVRKALDNYQVNRNNGFGIIAEQAAIAIDTIACLRISVPFL